jgi:hypothetical protein
LVKTRGTPKAKSMVPENFAQQRQLAIPKSKATKTPHYFLVQQACRGTLHTINYQIESLIPAERKGRKKKT